MIYSIIRILCTDRHITPNVQSQSRTVSISTFISLSSTVCVTSIEVFGFKKEHTASVSICSVIWFSLVYKPIRSVHTCLTPLFFIVVAKVNTAAEYLRFISWAFFLLTGSEQSTKFFCFRFARDVWLLIPHYLYKYDIPL